MYRIFLALLIFLLAACSQLTRTKDGLTQNAQVYAEDAFKSAVGQKVQDTLENKRKELAKGFVNKHIPEPEDDKTV